MLNRKNAIIMAAAALGAIPAISNAAATFVLTLDPTTFAYGSATASSSTYTALTSTPNSAGAYYNPATETVFIPVGDSFVYGYDGTMAGTDATADTVTGIGAFGFGLNNSTPSIAVPDGGSTTATTATKILNGTNKPVYNSVFNSGNGYAPGTVIHADNKGGGVSGGAIGIGLSNPTNIATTITSGLLVSNIQVDTSGAAGTTDKLTPTPTGASSFASYYYLTGTASAGFGSGEFATANTDSVTYTAAALTIDIVGGTTTTSPTHHPIVSLTNAAAGSMGNYGSQIGKPIVITGSNGSYVFGYTGTTLTDAPGTDPGLTTGFTAVSAFNPLTDTEVYALKLNNAAGAISPTSTLIATIVSDFNNGTGNGTAASNVSAGAVAGSAYASLFPGYDILLTSTTGFSAGAGGVADLGIDFSQDTDAATAGLTVTEVAAVPEPATAAGIVLGAAGLLLGRRKKQIATA